MMIKSAQFVGPNAKWKRQWKHIIKGTKVQNLFLPSGSFFLSLSTYHGAFYFLFNIMDPWAGGYSQGKCRSSKMLKNLTTQLSTSKIHQLQGSTSCRLLDPYTVPWMEVGKSILLSHDKWVTPNQPQLPGRDIPQYLDWGTHSLPSHLPNVPTHCQPETPDAAGHIQWTQTLTVIFRPPPKVRNNSRTQTFPHQCDHNSGGAEADRMRTGRAQDNKAWKRQQSKTGPKSQQETGESLGSKPLMHAPFSHQM